MARLDAKMMEFIKRAKVDCHFCDKTAEVVDGRLNRGDFVFWQQRELLVLCEECVGTFLPRMIADTGGSNPDLTWANATAMFWRTRANMRQTIPAVIELLGFHERSVWIFWCSVVRKLMCATGSASAPAHGEHWQSQWHTTQS